MLAVKLQVVWNNSWFAYKSLRSGKFMDIIVIFVLCKTLKYNVCGAPVQIFSIRRLSECSVWEEMGTWNLGTPIVKWNPVREMTKLLFRAQGNIFRHKCLGKQRERYRYEWSRGCQNAVQVEITATDLYYIYIWLLVDIYKILVWFCFGNLWPFFVYI